MFLKRLKTTISLQPQTPNIRIGNVEIHCRHAILIEKNIFKEH